jgi:UDP-3-O-[3-hydroxymyristoyl] glucosamine N-acyltransferase
VARHGGEARTTGHAERAVRELLPLALAGKGAIAPFFRASYASEALAAVARGAVLLTTPELAPRVPGADAWLHAHAVWAMAELLDRCEIPADPPAVGMGTRLGEHVVLGARVVIGRNVVIGPSCVIGEPGFGWVTGPDGRVRHVPQLGGVVIEDDVHLGALCTVDAGTLGPTILRRGAKLDAHVHVGHNTEIGEGCIIAAQTGFAGSVRLGKGVLVGGQAGFADHVTVGDGARVAAKSGVIGNVPAGATVAGYPAVLRARWLRAWGWVHRSSSKERQPKP